MENAVDALKLFFGVTIFALALTVFFRMTSLAKDTADIVFSAIDKTSLINYTVDVDEDDLDKGRRKVTIQEIMPTIYRYAQEGYGVTIVDGAEIVARFDLDTESQVSSCFWDDRYNQVSLAEQEKSNSIKYEIGNYLNEYIYGTIGRNNTKITLPDEANKKTWNDYGDLDGIIKKLYGTVEGSAEPVYTGWLKSNTYNNNYITQRINSDIYGDKAYFNLSNPGVNDNTPATLEGTHQPVCDGLGLLKKYKNVTFKEYIVQIDSNEYIKVTDENGNEEDTDLLVFGTLRNTKKREIIYVKQS